MRATLTQLYAATSASGAWHTQDGWLDPATPVCQWHGVSCDADQTAVLGLYLNSNGLSSEGCVDLSAVFAQLRDLETIDLGNNARLCLSGLDLRAHSQLQSLGLADCSAPGSPPLLLPDPSRLARLDLLRSTWSFNLSGSPLLETLNLYGYKQRFSLSAIPASSASALRMLTMDHAVELRGDLSDLCPLPNLSYLSMEGTALGSTLPADVAACWPRIQTLALVNSGLHGALPSFANLPLLQRIGLARMRPSCTHARHASLLVGMPLPFRSPSVPPHCGFCACGVLFCAVASCFTTICAELPQNFLSGSMSVDFALHSPLLHTLNLAQK